MKKSLICLAFLSLPLHGYTLKTDFLRIAKTYKNVQFPLDITGYLDLTFRVVLDEALESEGVTARIERRLDGVLMSSYSGFFAFGKEVWVEFPDGNVGPKVLFEHSSKQEVSSTEKTSNL